MFVLWALSPVWDPFDVKERGTWGAFRGAFPWIAALTALGEAVAVMIGRVRRGEPLEPENPLPAPEPSEEDLLPVGAWFRSLARFLAVGAAILAVICFLLAFAFAGQEPSGVLGTDPQGASSSSAWLGGGLAIVAIVLWWLGRERR
jgi:hypothetical protein